MNRIYVLILILILQACASSTPGEKAKFESGTKLNKLGVTGYIDSDLSFGNYIFVNLTFKNYSKKEWLRFKYSELLELTGDPNARIIVGEDLVTWFESVYNKKLVSAYNSQMLKASLFVGLTALAITSNNSDTSKIAHVGAQGIVATDAFNSIMQNLNKAERGRLVPKTHLYSDFSIPPELTTKKWILIQVDKKQTLYKMLFNIRQIDGVETNFSISEYGEFL